MIDTALKSHGYIVSGVGLHFSIDALFCFGWMDGECVVCESFILRSVVDLLCFLSSHLSPSNRAQVNCGMIHQGNSQHMIDVGSASLRVALLVGIVFGIGVNESEHSIQCNPLTT